MKLLFDLKFLLLSSLLTFFVFATPVTHHEIKCYECHDVDSTNSTFGSCNAENYKNWKVQKCERGCAIMTSLNGHTIYRGCTLIEDFYGCKNESFVGNDVMLCQCSADFCNANGTKALDNENTVMAPINNELSDGAQRLVCVSCFIDPFGKMKSTDPNLYLSFCDPIHEVWEMEVCSPNEICYNSTAAQDELEGVIIHGCILKQENISDKCQWVNKTLENGKVWEAMWTCYCESDLCNTADEQPRLMNNAERARLLHGDEKTDEVDQKIENEAAEITTIEQVNASLTSSAMNYNVWSAPLLFSLLYVILNYVNFI
uniref:Protein quiver n=1 Tax=Acrobeloides nanus TaxID=290746 RepID=A0A914BVK1_9BILA